MANLFDIHIQTVPSDEQLTGTSFMSFGYASSVGVKGFQQLINAWLKCFLTPKGSDPTNPDYGTRFTNLIGSTIPIKDAEDVISLAVNDCNQQIITLQRSIPDLTNTERLSSAKVVNLVELPSVPGFEAYVEIKNLANERLVLNLPPIAST